MNVAAGEALEALDKESSLIDMPYRLAWYEGVRTSVYGPFLEAMTIHGAQNLDGQHSVDSVVGALGVASSLYRAADARYTQQPGALTGEALEQHQSNVLAGNIVFVSPDAATTEQEGLEQVTTADRTLYPLPSRIEAALAALNYGATFRPQTMADATRTLDRREIDDLLQTMAETREAMPHLSVSNWAIGQTVAGLYANLARSIPRYRLRVFDIGSGHGATLAATTNSLQTTELGGAAPELAITALETTPEFYNQLGNFAEQDTAARDLGLEVVRHDKGVEGSISEFGALTTVNTDAVEALHNLNLFGRPDLTKNELVVVTANYSWHRLSSFRKAQLTQELQQLPNVIFIIGDLERNGSAVNRHFFNLAANGPLNAGNTKTESEFGKFGYPVVDISRKRPSSLNPRIAQRLADDSQTQDGHLWIAYSGDRAKEALELV